MREREAMELQEVDIVTEVVVAFSFALAVFVIILVVL
jgi:hypothetical protein